MIFTRVIIREGERPREPRGRGRAVAAQSSGRDKRDRSRWGAMDTDVRAHPTRKHIGNVRDTCAFHRRTHRWKSSGGNVAGEQKKCK